jgi:hypothetical protein
MGNKSGTGGNDRARGTQADRVMELIREGTAVQVELLGAAARVWSDIVERVANYNRELTNELLKFSAGETDANDSLDHLVREGKRHVKEFSDLPAKIGGTFKKRVEGRTRVGHPKD